MKCCHGQSRLLIDCCHSMGDFVWGFLMTCATCSRNVFTVGHNMDCRRSIAAIRLLIDCCHLIADRLLPFDCCHLSTDRFLPLDCCHSSAWLPPRVLIDCHSRLPIDCCHSIDNRFFLRFLDHICKMLSWSVTRWFWDLKKQFTKCWHGRSPGGFRLSLDCWHSMGDFVQTDRSDILWYNYSDIFCGIMRVIKLAETD